VRTVAGLVTETVDTLRRPGSTGEDRADRLDNLPGVDWRQRARSQEPVGGQIPQHRPVVAGGQRGATDLRPEGAHPAHRARGADDQLRARGLTGSQDRAGQRAQAAVAAQ
jgi:hypothetical protein